MEKTCWIHLQGLRENEQWCRKRPIGLLREIDWIRSHIGAQWCVNSWFTCLWGLPHFLFRGFIKHPSQGVHKTSFQMYILFSFKLPWVNCIQYSTLVSKRVFWSPFCWWGNRLREFKWVAQDHADSKQWNSRPSLYDSKVCAFPRFI